MDFFEVILKATKEYWFLITVVAGACLTLAYMVIFRVNPWDQPRSAKLRRDRIRFHNSVGYSLIETGHFTEALGEFEEALKLSAEDQTALNGRYIANLFLNIASPTADPAIGFAIHQRISETDSLKREQHLHIIDKYLGDLYTRINDLDKATTHYLSALDRCPDYPDALYALGWQYYSGGEGDVVKMEQMFRKLTEVEPHGYRGFHGLGYALYMMALKESDPDKRADLVRAAAQQSELAKNLYFNQLNIVMDFGEVARSVSPHLSIFFHDYGKTKILDDPVLRETGENPAALIARLLTLEGSVAVESMNDKLAWINYQKALDYLALQRMYGDENGEFAAEQKKFFDEAQALDPNRFIHFIYQDQLNILDMLLPEQKETGPGSNGE